MSRSRPITVAVVLFCLACASARASEPEAQRLEPVPLRVISPLRLLFFQLTPESASTLGRGGSNVGFDISESNVLHIRNRPASEFDAEINLEITRVNVRFGYGLSRNIDVGLELPVFRFHTGFLDPHIRNVEDFVGDLKVQRVFELEEPDGSQFRFRLKRDGDVFFELPGPTSGIGDLAFTVKRKIQDQDVHRPALSLRAALKLPTGDRDRAMGSGAVDFAAGIVADYQWRRWAAYGNVNGTFPLSGPFEAVGLLSPPMISAHLGGAYRPRRNWAFHFQLAGTSKPFELAGRRGPSPLPEVPFENFGGSIVDATLGASRRLNHKAEVFLALAEDFHNTTNAAADVTLLVSFGLRGDR